jgi:hypothetical protein
VWDSCNMTSDSTVTVSQAQANLPKLKPKTKAT